jgi:hypothetical protein
MTDECTRLRVLRRERSRELELAERRMAAQERALESRLGELDGDIKRAKNAIDADLRAEHWGREPERPPSWRQR